MITKQKLDSMFTPKVYPPKVSSCCGAEMNLLSQAKELCPDCGEPCSVESWDEKTYEIALDDRIPTMNETMTDSHYDLEGRME